MLLSIIMTVAAAGGVLAQAAGRQAAAAVPSRLLPLSEADQAGAAGSGCQFIFGQGDATYIFLIGQDIRFRTADGLRNCRLSAERGDAFSAGSAAVVCGGRRLSLRRVGPTETSPATDSAGGDAILTLTQGPHSRAIRGFWATAC